MSEDLIFRLRRVDMSAPAIQGAAGSMMKHYDRSSQAAVNEWRNALQTATDSQILPLLYVANEVLQTSKRNRGNKFLEAFSPILKQSLVYMAQKLHESDTEKIRRTIKIWGDRRVFSVRYVNELLQAMEPYRPGNRAQPPPDDEQESDDEPTFSPAQNYSETNTPTPTKQQQSSQDTTTTHEDDDESHDEIMDILEAHDHPKNSDDDDSMFGDDSERQTLDIEINVDAVTHQSSPALLHKRRQKRRRSSASATGPGKKVLSATNLLDLWNQLAEMSQKYELAQHTVTTIQESLSKTTADDLSNLVGDDLQMAVRQNHADRIALGKQRKILYTLARDRHTLQQEAARYLPWLEQAVAHDQQDLLFCDTLEAKITQFQPVQAQLQATREVLRQEEEARQKRMAEAERKRLEAEEHERFRKAALAKETEAKPGMVWNPTTREYQSLNTDESWRD